MKRVNGMKNVKLHLWFGINAIVLLLMYLYPYLMQTPIYAVFIFSGWLLRTKEEIKKEYTSKVPWYGVTLALLLPVVLIISAVTGFTEQINTQFNESNTKYVVIVMGIFLLLVYGYFVFKGKDEQKT